MSAKNLVSLHNQEFLSNKNYFFKLNFSDIMSRLGMKGVPLPGGPAGAFIAAGAVLGVVYVFFKVEFNILLEKN